MLKKILLLCIGIWLILSVGSAWERADSGGIRLESPAFVALAAEAQGQTQEKGVNFLQQEAGISAYVNAGQTIDLVQARGAFKTVETVSDEYLIGEVALPKLPEEVHPHVYVNKDGWIVAYYTKDEPANKIMQWIGYRGEAITTTTLEDAIRKVLDALQLSYPSEVKYYSFKYPNANRITLITEIIDAGGEDSFYLTIPTGLQIYEASWTLYVTGDDSGSIIIDDASLGRGGNGFLYGDLTSRLKKDFRHTVKVNRNCRYGCNFVGMAIVLIYQM